MFQKDILIEVYPELTGFLRCGLTELCLTNENGGGPIGLGYPLWHPTHNTLLIDLIVLNRKSEAWLV